jgi:hypothetical protein
MSKLVTRVTRSKFWVLIGSKVLADVSHNSSENLGTKIPNGAPNSSRDI